MLVEEGAQFITTSFLSFVNNKKFISHFSSWFFLLFFSMTPNESQRGFLSTRFALPDF